MASSYYGIKPILTLLLYSFIIGREPTKFHNTKHNITLPKLNSLPWISMLRAKKKKKASAARQRASGNKNTRRHAATVAEMKKRLETAESELEVLSSLPQMTSAASFQATIIALDRFESTGLAGPYAWKV